MLPHGAVPANSSVLLIDDSPGECELFGSAVTAAGIPLCLHIVRDREGAVGYLDQALQSGTLPSLILLDLKLRHEFGLDILKDLRIDRRLAHLPIVIFTNSDAAADIAASYGSGANGYVVKPDTFDRLVDFVMDLHRYWIRWNRTLHGASFVC